ncbi:MAG: hypothetical protein JO336_12170, partial [Acidobacteriia bacterium]|nr:hypothetical protein [Terriglobia bacterium]
TWTQQVSGGGGGVTNVFGRTGAVVAQTGDYTAAQITNAVATNTGNVYTAGTQDFRAAAHTLPAVTGLTSARPSTCTIGEMYFATDAIAGQNWYFCTATNTWTQQVNGGGGGVSTVFGRNGAVTAQTGDYTAAQVTNAASTNASNVYTAGTQDFRAAAHTIPTTTGATANRPSTCTVGEEYFATDATAGQNKYLCTATNAWTQQIGGSATITETTYIPLAAGGTSSSSAVFGPGALGDTANSSSSLPTRLNGSGFNVPAYTFANDANTAQYIYLTSMLPQNWLSAGAVNITVHILKGATAGTAEFNVATFCSSGTSGLNAPSWNTNSDQGVTVTSSSQAFYPAYLTWSGVSMTGCAAGSTLQIRVSRDQANTSDNLAGSIYLLGVQLQFQHS